MSSVPTPSSFRAASQELHPTSFWQLTPFSCMFCGRQSSLLLWHYLLQLIVEKVEVLRHSVLHVCHVKMSGLRLFLSTDRVPCYHLCMYTVFSFMSSDCMCSPKVGSLSLGHAVSLQSAAAQLGYFLAAWVWRMITVYTTIKATGDAFC